MTSDKQKQQSQPTASSSAAAAPKKKLLPAAQSPVMVHNISQPVLNMFLGGQSGGGDEIGFRASNIMFADVALHNKWYSTRGDNDNQAGGAPARYDEVIKFLPPPLTYDEISKVLEAYEPYLVGDADKESKTMMNRFKAAYLGLKEEW